MLESSQPLTDSVVDSERKQQNIADGGRKTQIRIHNSGCASVIAVSP